MPALDGVDRLFLLIPSSSEVEQQQRHFVDAAKRSKVRHLVKLSQLAADEHAAGRFQRYHAAVEKHILKSDIPYTFLRPNLFMQGLFNFRSTIASRGAFYAPGGDARVSIVDVRDIASIAAKALTELGHAGKTYDITGPEALTHAEMAQQLSKPSESKSATWMSRPQPCARHCCVSGCLRGRPMASSRTMIITAMAKPRR
jgi:uncharacterized protein YbjT (DUF2867 family)